MKKHQQDVVTIEDVTTVSILGTGTQGIVWSARLKSQKPRDYPQFALKERLIKKTDAQMLNTKTSSSLREIVFYREVANKYPLFFTKLYDWKIFAATKEDKSKFNEEKNEKYTHIFVTLSARKEGILKDVFKTLDQAQWLSMLSQICYALSLIREHGFSHGDVWESNIAFNRVAWDSNVSIYTTKLQTLGYVWSIIDYGSVRLDSDERRVTTHDKRSSSYDLDHLLVLISGQDAAQKQCKVYEEDNIKKFSEKVFNSVDGPSVRAIMKKTGLPIGLCVALLSLDAYVWHLCGKRRDDDVKAWINRGLILEMSDARASYGNLALRFAHLAKNAVRGNT